MRCLWSNLSLGFSWPPPPWHSQVCCPGLRDPEMRTVSPLVLRNSCCGLCAMPVFVLDRKVSTSVPLGNSHSFVRFLLSPRDIGPAQLSTTSPPPWSPQGKLRCVCVYFYMKSQWEEKCPQKRTCSPSTFNYPQKEKNTCVLDNLFEIAMQQKHRQCCSIIFTCSSAEETNLSLRSPWAAWGQTSFPSPASSWSTCWQASCWHFGNLHLLCSQIIIIIIICQIKYYCPIKNIFFFSRNAFLPLSESSPNHHLYLHFTSSNKTKRRQ